MSPPHVGAPSIELKEFMEVEQGSDISIVAKIRGCPFPTLTWYKAPPHKSDDKVEVVYDEHINKIVSDDSCTLLIQQGKRPDTGLYTLVASNSLGKASKEMRLNVLGKKSAFSLPRLTFSNICKLANKSVSTAEISLVPLLKLVFGCVCIICHEYGI